jgi:hypothetical protein
LHPVALELLRRTGPLAVTGAHLDGMPPSTTVGEAESQLGGAVAVYLDGGSCSDNVPSTILDLTGTVPRMLRAGVITIDQLRKVVPVIDLAAPPAAGGGVSEVSDAADSPDDKPAEPHPLAGGDAGPGS